MSEVTGAPPAEDDSSAASTRRTTKPGTKRLILTLSVVIPFLLSLPFLLKSTEIYRSPLPFDSIDSLSARLRSDPLSLPCRFQAIFIVSDPRSLHADQLALSISDGIRSRTANNPARGGCGTNYTVSVTVDSGTDCVGVADACWRCGALVDPSGLGGSDEVVDELLDAALRESGECSESGGGRVYTFVAVEREEEARVVVGKHRHAWMVGRVSEMDVVSMASRIFVDFFMNGGKEEGEMEQGKGEFMPVGSDGSVILSFSLLNADPNDWVYDWDFQKIDKTMLAQVVEALAPIAKISTESQVLYHTPMSSISYWDNNLGSYIFTPRDLPFFVNSNEWHLDTSIAAAGRSKVLQFVVYVPSATDCPLILRLPNGEISKTNGFISPMWGGVVVWNPPNCFKDSQRTHVTGHTISHEDLHKIFQVFIGQLRLLFGFKSDYFHPTEVGISNFLSSERGFTEWELDALYRHHACYNLISSVTTLVSLSKLVQSLPRMIVKDEIGKQVKLSLDAASLAQQNASIGIYDASAVSSRKARALAEDAFFHPSIMSISYSSIEHYFAIYMPFFAPVSLHVLMAAIKEIKRYRREQAKYLAFVADQARAA